MPHKCIRTFDADVMEGLLHGLKISSYNLVNYDNTKIPEIKEVSIDDLTISDSLSCSLCKIQFENQSEQRNHYKLEWHRFNLKQQLNQQSSISELEHGKLMVSNTNNFPDPNLATESESGSGSDSEDDGVDQESEESSGRVYGKVLFENSAGNILSFHQCMLYNKKSVPSHEDELIQITRNCYRNLKIMIIILGGGHFASAIFNGANIVVNKTLHYYIVRAKQGSAQSSRDNRSSGSHLKSAGASLRRHNEFSLIQHVREIITSWKDEISTTDIIFYRAPGPVNKDILFGGKNPVFEKLDKRLRFISISTRRATHREVIRVHTSLTTVDVYETKNDFDIEFKKLACVKKKRLDCPRRMVINRSKSREIKDRSLLNLSLNESLLTNSDTENDDDFDDTLVIEMCEQDTREQLQQYANTAVRRKKKNRFEPIKSPLDEDTTSATDSVRSSRVPSPVLVVPPSCHGDGEGKNYQKLRSWFMHGCKTGDLHVLDNYLMRAKRDISNGALNENDLNRVLSESVTKNGDTLLHVAVAIGNVGLIEWLMDNDASPCQRNKNNLTPYTVTNDRTIRDVFRSFAYRNPDKFDYAKAQIPVTRMSKEDLLQKRKEQKRIKKSRDKEKRLAKQKEDEQIRQFHELSDREKRALAAEKRIQAENNRIKHGNRNGDDNAIVIRCFICGSDLTTVKPFEYSGNLFCTMTCLKTHRQQYGLLLSV